MKLPSLLLVLLFLPSAGAQTLTPPKRIEDAEAARRAHLKTYVVPPQDDISRKMHLDLYQNSETAWITDEIRPIVIDRLLYQLDYNINPSFASELERHLITLGHVPTIKRYLADTWAYPYPDGVHRDMPWAPAALPYMMDIVYHGSTVSGLFDTNYGYATQREGACIWVLQTIWGYAQEHGVPFPKETQQWAQKMELEKTYHNEGSAELIQQWYEQNKAAIVKGRYHEASWLPRYKGELFINSTAQREARLAEEARQRALRRPAFSSAVESFSRSAMFWPTLAALAALLASYIFYRLRRCSS